MDSHLGFALALVIGLSSLAACDIVDEEASFGGGPSAFGGNLGVADKPKLAHRPRWLASDAGAGKETAAAPSDPTPKTDPTPVTPPPPLLPSPTPNALPCEVGASGPRLTTLTPSGAIDAQTGGVYSGLRISNANGPCVVVNGASNVRIVDSEIGPCGGESAIVVEGGATGVTVENTYVHDSSRGVLVTNASAVTKRSRFERIVGVAPRGTAIEYDYVPSGGSIAENCVSGTFGSDAISGFQSSGLSIVDNELHVAITEPSSAPFTIGDSVNGSPGHDNVVSGNKVYQSGGVPPGVFGSTGNTVLEHNCLTSGIQAYAYNGPFVGVTVRNNLIGPGSFVPDTSVIAGWSTNTFTSGGACP